MISIQPLTSPLRLAPSVVTVPIGSPVQNKLPRAVASAYPFIILLCVFGMYPYSAIRHTSSSASETCLSNGL